MSKADLTSAKERCHTDLHKTLICAMLVCVPKSLVAIHSYIPLCFSALALLMLNTFLFTWETTSSVCYRPFTTKRWGFICVCVFQCYDTKEKKSTCVNTPDKLLKTHTLSCMDTHNVWLYMLTDVTLKHTRTRTCAHTPTHSHTHKHTPNACIYATTQPHHLSLPLTYITLHIHKCTNAHVHT